MTPVLRLQQGLRALTAFTRQPDYELAARYLSPPLLDVFKRMQRSEQLHSLRVLSAVLAQAPETPRALAVAALMHDCGKSRYPVSVAGKTAAVLVRKFAPPLMNRLSESDPRRWWARPFAAYRQHPAWSGELLTANGADADSAWLAAHHADSPDRWRDHALYPLLIRLQAADDRN